MTPASDADIIRWQLKCLAQESDQLTDSEFGWVVKFEQDFETKGFLTDRQMEVLEDIYKRRS